MGGLIVRHSNCGRRRDPSLLQTEYRPSSASRDYGLGGGEGGRHLGEAGHDHGQHLADGEEECFHSLQRKSILKNKPNCDTLPDLIPHHDNESWNFLVSSDQGSKDECKGMIRDFHEDEDFCHKAKQSSPAANILSLASGSRDGLLLLTSSEARDADSPLFPNKISTSTLKRGNSCKRTFLLKEKRESIV